MLKIQSKGIGPFECQKYIQALLASALCLGCDSQRFQPFKDIDRFAEHESPTEVNPTDPSLSDTTIDGVNHKKLVIEFNGISRTTYIYVPSKLMSDLRTSLVVVLHGGGGSGSNMPTKTGFSQIAEREKFIVAYPTGTNATTGIEGEGNNTWNDTLFEGSGTQRPDDVAYLSALAAKLKHLYSPVVDHIFLCGHSNGGMMTYATGSANPSSFLTALGVVSGTVGGQKNPSSPVQTIGTPLGPLPLIIIHGKQDGSVPYDGGHGPDTSGQRIYLAVSKSLEFWQKTNDLIGISPKISETAGLLTEVYAAEGKMPIKVLSVIQGQHGWPQLSDGLPIEAAEEIWTFFKSQF